MKTVENLEGKEMLLVSAKKVNGGKIQLEFAQHISNPNARPSSIVGLLNESDDRFNNAQGGPRRAWLAGEVSDIQGKLGIDLSSLVNVGDSKELNVLNPTIKGMALNIQITETTEGTEYDVQNFESRAKRAGKDGLFITTMKGEYIYTRTTVVLGEAKHTFINETKREDTASGLAASAIQGAIS
jgi:hypothetical protein